MPLLPHVMLHEYYFPHRRPYYDNYLDDLRGRIMSRLRYFDASSINGHAMDRVAEAISQETGSSVSWRETHDYGIEVVVRSTRVPHEAEMIGNAIEEALRMRMPAGMAVKVVVLPLQVVPAEVTFNLKTRLERVIQDEEVI